MIFFNDMQIEFFAKFKMQYATFNNKLNILFSFFAILKINKRILIFNGNKYYSENYYFTAFVYHFVLFIFI